MATLDGVTGHFPDAIYRIEQGIISIGRVFRVYDTDRNLVAYVKHPLLKIKEQFDIYADEAETKPLLKAKVRRLIQLNVCFDLTEPESETLLLSVKKRAIRSIFRDRMEILDAEGTVIGSVDEVGFALLRRFIKWLPHHWVITIRGEKVAKVDQRFTFFRKKIDVDLTGNTGRIDPRAALAAVLTLMHEVEGAG